MIILETKLSLHTSPEKLWEVLVDLESYQDWNPYLIAGKGNVKKRGKLKIGMKIEEGHAFYSKPKIKKFDPPHLIEWKSMLYIPKFFDRLRSFEITPEGNHKVLFTHKEVWSGYTAHRVYDKLGKQTEHAMKEMNAALRKRVKKS